MQYRLEKEQFLIMQILTKESWNKEHYSFVYLLGKLGHVRILRRLK